MDSTLVTITVVVLGSIVITITTPPAAAVCMILGLGAICAAAYVATKKG
jgi:energy-converting hydrogenase Eha subunit C